MTSPETAAKGDAGSAGTRSGVPAVASVSARTTIRRASSILKPLSPEGFAVRERRLGGAMEKRGIGRCAGQDLFRFTGSPRFHGNAAEREARFHDRIVLDAQRGRGRYDRERVGGAFANF